MTMVFDMIDRQKILDENLKSDDLKLSIFLLWSDAIQRLDTIISEIRHQQVNIIQHLREPSLYQALEFEEQFIWGKYTDDALVSKSWREKLSCQKPLKIVSYSEKCAYEWVISFPRFGEKQMGANNNHNNIKKEIVEQIVKSLDQIWSSGSWGQEERRLYSCLMSLQLLKRRIISDKLILDYWGLNTELLDSNFQKLDRSTVVNFLIIRNSILSNAHGYLKDLGLVQTQVERTLDLGIPLHPRPYLNRRREQGVYIAYLSDCCDDLYRDLNHLFSKFNLFKKRPAGPVPTILHGWEYKYLPSIRFKKIKEDSIDCSGEIFIQTSFFF